jgi:hypothetical protein
MWSTTRAKNSSTSQRASPPSDPPRREGRPRQPAEAHRALAVLDPHRPVCREAAVAPGQEVVDGRLGDELLVVTEPGNLGLGEHVV